MSYLVGVIFCLHEDHELKCPIIIEEADSHGCNAVLPLGRSFHNDVNTALRSLVKEDKNKAHRKRLFANR